MFIITKDKICEGEFNGFTFLRSSKTGKELKELTAKVKPACVHKFRLLDDDGEIYCYGVSNNHDTEKLFDPLDWGMAEFGCTEIQYYENGKWETA